MKASEIMTPDVAACSAVVPINPAPLFIAKYCKCPLLTQSGQPKPLFRIIRMCS